MVKPFSAMPGVMRDRAAEVQRGTTVIVRRAARAIDRGVVFGTPVDEGTARSNWVATLNVPFSGVIPAYAPGSKLGIAERGNAQGAIVQASGVINQYQAGRTRTIHFTNNVPYIERLNNGSSLQAPAMFVQRGIQAGIVSLKGVRVLRG